MGAREFLIYLDVAHENRYRHWQVWKRSQIVEFRIQYEAHIAGQWHPIVRYDTAHGVPHKDTLHPDATQTKEVYSGYSQAQVLTIGQRDIMENWPQYRARYEKELGR